MLHVSVLTEAQRSQVRDLVEACQNFDGVSPLNEEAQLALSRDEAQHWLAYVDEVLVGYAQLDDIHGTGQLCVHPQARRRKVGTALVTAVLTVRPDVQLWAFGHLDAAEQLARSFGMSVQRGLFIMSRPLPAPDVAAVLPDGIHLESFTPEHTEAFLAVNARAFADHPEQGQFSASDLLARQAEPWWDPAGLLMAFDSDGLAGFHWTKRQSDTQGEVYVIGVDPRWAGRGLGRALLAAGLNHLAKAGCTEVILYVEATNDRAVNLYTHAGFTVTHQDVCYGFINNG